jgi:hypothetical protein
MTHCWGFNGFGQLGLGDTTVCVRRDASHRNDTIHRKKHLSFVEAARLALAAERARGEQPGWGTVERVLDERGGGQAAT